MRRADLGFTDELAKGVFSVLGESGSRVIFRSNVTPDITIDISGLMKAKAGKTPPSKEVPVSSEDKGVLKIIKPEVSLKALGAHYNYAPYGRPSKEFAIALLAGFVITGLIGARIAWGICRRI